MDTETPPGPGVDRADEVRLRAISEELPESLTPWDALAAVAREPDVLFLESGGAVGGSSEWTILAFDPLWRIELRDGALSRIARGDSGTGDRASVMVGHPLDALRTLWPRVVDWLEPPPIPFASGLAGYLAYDLKDWIERLPARARRESGLPDLALAFYDVVWAWNRRTGERWLVSSGLGEGDPDRRESRARARIAEQRSRVLRGAERAARSMPSICPQGATERPRVVSNFSRARYEEVVLQALHHIAAGDIYQVNLAQRYMASPAPEPLALYERLRAAAPAPFSAYVRTRAGAVLSSSPERFFRVRGRTIETRPIKGTRPRGATPDEDRRLIEALRASEKDRAENLMIVDLERNDLGRICEVGSIGVPALWETTSHSNVHHLESRVEGILRADVDPVEIIRALFPGGSITGAPKIRAMEIIDALEPVRRGPYTGAIGYWDVSGGADFNIAIRTIIVEGGHATFHVGGGIVADSDPGLEYEETLAKAAGMMRALGVESRAEAV